MYDFDKEVLVIDGRSAPIASFRVGFATPWGVLMTLKEAVTRCQELDMDATLVIQPVVLVEDQAGRSEIIIRR